MEIRSQHPSSTPSPTSPSPIGGIHHVTALTDDPAVCIAFYAGVLGLKLVKRTVNYDDPSAYHLYFGDSTGEPGTLLTFFALPGGRAGRIGSGQTTQTVFQVPEDALAFWKKRLESLDFVCEDGPGGTLFFNDPDGLSLGLIARGAPSPDSRTVAGIPIGAAIQRIHGVVLASSRHDDLQRLLSEHLTLQKGVGGSPFFVAGSDPALDFLLIRPETDGVPRGLAGVGTVHHLALRVPNDSALESWRTRLDTLGYDVTEVRERTYFRSIYFREPGGILLELATDGPGFLVDESPEHLGETLALPSWLENRRAELQNALPPLPSLRREMA